MPNDSERLLWTKKVNQVFNTMPRNGNKKATVWLARSRLEDRIRDVFGFDGVNVCVDGPTGSGKTSLVITNLHRLNLKYVMVIMTKSMDWISFCRQLLTPPSVHEESWSANVQLGLRGVVPSASLQVSLGEKIKTGEDIDLALKMSQQWTEFDVCKLLSDQNAILFIDDFENASPEIIMRVASMMKILTQRFQGKVVVVGTGTSYLDLIESNQTLEGRVEEISVSTLQTANESWNFLRLGLDALRLSNPAREIHERRRSAPTRDELAECVRAVYDAADGLPKSLNELGRDISMEGIGRSRVSVADIKKCANEMVRRNLLQFSRQFPDIMKLVRGHVEARIVLQHLYNTGIGQVHFIFEIKEKLSSIIPANQVELGIKELLRGKLIVQTGLRGDRVFSANPTLAHTLGVVIENPKRYGQDPRVFLPAGQLTLPFSFDIESNTA